VAAFFRVVVVLSAGLFSLSGLSRLFGLSGLFGLSRMI